MSPITPETDLFAEIPKRGPGRPRKPTPTPAPTKKPRVATKPAPQKKKAPKPLYINNINNTSVCGSVLDGDRPLEVIENIEEMIKGSDLKDKLTAEELRFVGYHIIQGLPVVKAMILAGYQNIPERTLYFKAKRILQRYEAQAEDRRNIMRALSIGEIAVIRQLWHEAQNAASAGARVQALIALGKWLGMDQEALQGAQGITVVIQALDSPTQVNIGQPPETPALPDPGGYRHPQPGRPGGPITITK